MTPEKKNRTVNVLYLTLRCLLLAAFALYVMLCDIVVLRLAGKLALCIFIVCSGFNDFRFFRLHRVHLWDGDTCRICGAVSGGNSAQDRNECTCGQCRTTDECRHIFDDTCTCVICGEQIHDWQYMDVSQGGPIQVVSVCARCGAGYDEG